MIDAYASFPHYWRHLAPIVEALQERGHDVRTWSRSDDFAPVMRPGDRDRVEVALVASHDDAMRFRDRPTIYVEHGAGQSYVGWDGGGYAGARDLSHVTLFVCPNEMVAAAWRERYTDVPAIAVGSPALDQHGGRVHVDGCLMHSLRMGSADCVCPPRKSATRVVAFTFHWRCAVCPETMPALDHYLPSLDATIQLLRASGVTVLGHSHPKGYGLLQPVWKGLSVPHEQDPDVVLRTADVIVADNTSLLYEAAALDIPTVVLNAPWYRREIHHGLRFWSHVPGAQVNEPDELPAAILAALDDDDDEARGSRRRAAARAYAAVDGCAGKAAAQAIGDLR